MSTVQVRRGVNREDERDYLIGASAPVQCAQIAWELAMMLKLYRERQPAHVLELGTWAGGTLYHWLQNAVEGATVVTVDSLVDAPDNRHLYGDWVPEGVSCFPIIGDTTNSDTFDAVKQHGPFEWVFVDALHTYANAKQDWENYRQLAADDAVVAFHDICLRRFYPETGETAGVWQLWEEIQRAGYVTQEIVCHPAQVEFGIGLVYLGSVNPG